MMIGGRTPRNLASGFSRLDGTLLHPDTENDVANKQTMYRAYGAYMKLTTATVCFVRVQNGRTIYGLRDYVVFEHTALVFWCVTCMC